MSNEMFEYTIVMKNGTKYKVKSNQLIDELMKTILPRYANDIRLTNCEIVDTPNHVVLIIGSEVSSVEYTVN